MRLLKVFLLQIVMMACFFIADQVTKEVFVGARAIPLFTSRWISVEVSGALNTGLAFSLPVAAGVALVLNVLVLVAVIGYWFSRLESRESWWLAVIIGGAFGNIVDRFTYGGVIDWLGVDWFGLSRSSVNLADLFILVGALGWLFAHSSGRAEVAAGLKESES